MASPHGPRAEICPAETALSLCPTDLPGFIALRRVRVPGAAGFRLHMREAGAGGRIGDADEMLAGRALDLASGVARVARERLIAVCTVEFEFSRVHGLSNLVKSSVPIMRQPDAKSIWKK